MKDRNVTVPMLLTVAILLLVVILVITVMSLPRAAPKTGTVIGKSSYPEFYPVTDNPKTVYAIIISYDNGRRACTWLVDEATYHLYDIGDTVRRGEIRRSEAMDPISGGKFSRVVNNRPKKVPL